VNDSFLVLSFSRNFEDENEDEEDWSIFDVVHLSNSPDVGVYDEQQKRDGRRSPVPRWW